ncbi:MAG: hypothetical protein ACYTKD_29060 [Planctomycetota bacterium]
MEVACPNCGETASFDQPHPYHAGHGDQGFLYDDSGTLTLVWSGLDPAYGAIVGDVHPWALDEERRRLLESRLAPAPNGERWRFGNPPRCTRCGAPIGKPITEDVCYFVYPDSVVTDGPEGTAFASVVRDEG